MAKSNVEAKTMEQPSIYSTAVGFFVSVTCIVSIAASYQYAAQGFFITIGSGLVACVMVATIKIVLKRSPKH